MKNLNYNFSKISDNNKTFANKIQQAEETIGKVEKADITPLTGLINKLKEEDSPVYFFAAGAAMSPTLLVTEIALEAGIPALAATPLDIVALPESVCKKARFVAISGSGKPTDMRDSTARLLNIVPDRVFALTSGKQGARDRYGRIKNKVYSLFVDRNITDQVFNFDLGISDEGFVGTIKHLIIPLLFFRACHPEVTNLADLLLDPTKVPFETRFPDNFTFKDISDLHILHGLHSRAAASGMESYMLETGVLPSMLANFKNFTHGRHVFIKNRPNSAFIMFESPEDKKFTKKLLKLIPKEQPVIFVRTERKDLLGIVELMICSFYLALELGEQFGINLFTPGATDWGTKMWSLNLKDSYNI